MPLNTSDSVYRRDEPKGAVEPVPLDEVDPHVINTSAIYEPEPEGTMQYLDEIPEVSFVLPGQGWFAQFEDEHHEPLVAWTVLDDGSVYGVAADEAGVINVNESVGDREGFVKYTNNDRSN